MGGGGEWTDRDRTLTLALTMFEAGTCSECGQHVSICRDEGKTFTVVKTTCQAKAALDTEMAALSKSGVDPEPGQIMSAQIEDESAVVFGASPFA